MKSEDYLRSLLSKVRRILPDIAESLVEAEDDGANEEWLRHAHKRFADVQKAADDAEAFLHD